MEVELKKNISQNMYSILHLYVIICIRKKENNSIFYECIYVY